MEVGQPGTPAPAAARAALARGDGARRRSATPWRSACPSCARASPGLYRDWYGVDLDPGRVVVTAGSSAGFILAFTSLFERGDRVAIGEPGYPSLPQHPAARSTSCRSASPTGPEDRFQPAPARPDARTSPAALVASPANPTGTMLARSELAALIERARGARHRLRLRRDLPRHRTTAPARSRRSRSRDEVYVINSFSKYFSMTGWRIGWMVVPEAHVRRIERLVQNLFICAPHASQVAALAALDATEELEANRRRLPRQPRADARRAAAAPASAASPRRTAPSTSTPTSAT